jgi:hypothetical protein
MKEELFIIQITKLRTLILNFNQARMKIHHLKDLIDIEANLPKSFTPISSHSGTWQKKPRLPIMDPWLPIDSTGVK